MREQMPTQCPGTCSSIRGADRSRPPPTAGETAMKPTSPTLFHLLTRDEQRAAIHKLARQGLTEIDISRLCELHPEQVRQILADPAPTHSAETSKP